ncbi:ankyrin repeat protein [Legionella massiliensis]|uniref:Ankyrin repeat protein n=1 Tax=Legionella massiliensis TaxID=1034943 RepID=A0A078KSK1_9GAMM|nr:ankyrin repeat domain-containing protein [Legionella massiliensis]CDZ75917.1 ankyrin repeat protein [Legionella massiliensis]CEE11655.1 Ankyrin repeats (3 copies) [Legionella massiliensis]
MQQKFEPRKTTSLTVEEIIRLKNHINTNNPLIKKPSNNWTSLLQKCLNKIDRDEYPELEEWMIIADTIFSHILSSNNEVTEIEILLSTITHDYLKAYKTRELKEFSVHPFTDRRKPIAFLLVGPSLPSSLMRGFYELNIDLNTRDFTFFDNTILMWLVANACNDSALALLEVVKAKPYCKEMLDAISLKGTSAIHLVVGKGYRDIRSDKEKLGVSNLALLKEMIALGADINIKMQLDPNDYNEEIFKSINKSTALHLACARRDIEFINFLVEHGADLNLKNGKGQTAFDMLRIDKEEAKSFVDNTVSPNNFDTIYHDNEEIFHHIKGYDEYLANQSNNSITLASAPENEERLDLDSRVDSCTEKTYFAEQHQTLLRIMSGRKEQRFGPVTNEQKNTDEQAESSSFAMGR